MSRRYLREALSHAETLQMNTQRRAASGTLLSVVFAATVAAPAHAQLPDLPDPDTVRTRVGPFYLNPTVALTNAGVDENVFNEADSLEPRSDFTMTLTPASDIWLRAGPTWIASRV